jgi:hypothetical protein
MIKNYLFLALLLFSSQLFSQKAYFVAGSNITKYSFKSSEGSMTTPLQSGTGSSYEIGYSSALKGQKIFYDISITLNDYNAVAGTPANSYRWETKYIGVQNAVSYNIPVTKGFQLMLNGGVNIGTIIYGKQTSNGVVYDIVDQDEFSGVFFSPFVGAHALCKLSDFGHLSLGYSFSKSLNPFNVSPDKLSFNTNQILFGIHFNIKNK